MKQYIKKPVIIDAVQWNGNIIEIAEIVIAGKVQEHPLLQDKLQIDTLEGTMIVDLGDWIIKGIKGEYYPCKPDIFKATYEEVTR